MTTGKIGRCPTCRGEAVKDANQHWPFCSERCHLIDLGRWFGEEYRIPGEPASEGGEQVPGPEDE